MTNQIAEMHTSKGIMTIELYNDDAPKTVENFVSLINKGFYDGLTFHRYLENFVIQGGCPTGTGTGGPGYTIPCELDGKRQKHDFGILSMAHAGRNTGGSQFFICHSRANTKHLDREHTCFGIVTDGHDTIKALREGDRIEKIIIKG
jgi:peptidyl-prolyl cis-trans isomerase B (cyclophilin B)